MQGSSKEMFCFYLSPLVSEMLCRLESDRTSEGDGFLGGLLESLFVVLSGIGSGQERDK